MPLYILQRTHGSKAPIAGIHPDISQAHNRTPPEQRLAPGGMACPSGLRTSEKLRSRAPVFHSPSAMGVSMLTPCRYTTLAASTCGEDGTDQ